MKSHFQMMACYNRWANERLYEAASTLPDELYRKDIGLFFKSLHGTLNHILTGDRIWMHRLDGKGSSPGRLNEVQHEEFAELRKARNAEDERIAGYVEALDEGQLEKQIDYTNTRGQRFQDPVGLILPHLFNHQTHHRGQAHTGLSLLTGAEPPSLDLIGMVRASRRP
jgi:uncharacterized damage-inducible protein DinB